MFDPKKNYMIKINGKIGLLSLSHLMVTYESYVICGVHIFTMK